MGSGRFVAVMTVALAAAACSAPAGEGFDASEGAMVDGDAPGDFSPPAPAIDGKLRPLVGTWKKRSGPAVASCPSGDLRIPRAYVGEAEFDSPWDIHELGGGAEVALLIDCAPTEWDPYFAPADGAPYPSFSVPIDGAAQRCSWGTVASDPEGVDYGVQWCSDVTLGAGEISASIVTKRRTEPFTPTEEEPWPDATQGYAVDGSAPRCTSSLKLSGEELELRYDCHGVRGTWTFVR